jgi:molybdopterin adenylyltransferase
VEILVLTVSDRASGGIYEDRSGPAVEAVVRTFLPDAVVRRLVVPDEPQAIRRAFGDNAGVDFILTTGGTGISPRDVTPEVTADWCERLIPGIAERLRIESYARTPNAILSRGTAGVRGMTIIINFPGSQQAAEFCAGIIGPVMKHMRAMIRGEGH